MKEKASVSIESTEVDDAQWIRRVLDGDAAAYSELVRRYQSRLFAIVYAMTGNREDAEDLTQEAFARAFWKLNTFQHRSSFATWLSHIAMNLTRSHRRKHRHEKSQPKMPFDLAMEEAVARGPQVDQRSIEQEQSEKLRQAILRLDEERRSILILRDVDGMDYESIAETLDVPIGTVRSRLHRARLELREIIVTMIPSLIQTEDATK
jgi:RNA polymerase sigma-70 factor (ECF subfamily)